jgi:hypothetical protein
MLGLVLAMWMSTWRGIAAVSVRERARSVANVRIGGVFIVVDFD